MWKSILLAAIGLAFVTAPAKAQVVVITGGSAPPGFYSVTTPPLFGGIAFTDGGVYTFPVAPAYPTFGYPGSGAYTPYPPHPSYFGTYPGPWRR
jgi:hypothetical protein